MHTPALDFDASSRRNLAPAVLVSLSLHVAILTIPFGILGSPQGSVLSAPVRTLTAALRAPEPSIATQPPVAALAAPQAPALAEIRSGSRPEPVGATSLPVTYFEVAQLSEPPRPLAEPPVELLQPVLAHPGAVRMRLFIDERGNVDTIDVVNATLPAEATKRAVAIFSNLPFLPARIGRFAVKSQVAITVGAADEASSYAAR